MPLVLNHPGVYVEELPSATRTITGVATSIAAFVGRAWRGPVDQPTTVFSFPDYQRQFGGLWTDSTMSYAVQQFFQNGGSQAIVVRVATRTGSTATAATFSGFDNALTFEAASPGSWGMNLKVSVDNTNTMNSSDTSLFHLTVLDDPDSKKDALAQGGSGVSEKFLNVSVNPANPRYVNTVLSQQSQLLRVDASSSSATTAPTPLSAVADASSGTDGVAIGTTEVVDSPNDTNKTGMYALDNADIFNLLVIPPYTPTTDNDIASTWAKASDYCKKRRALLLVDAPSAWTPANATTTAVPKVSDYSAITRSSAAIYFPRLLLADPLKNNSLRDFAPTGVVAGIFARTDAARGVWKAPAGIDTNLQGVMGLYINGAPGTLTDDDISLLNPVGVNSLRGLPTIGQVVWGSRTLEGADVLSSQWKYVPVRRLALFLEESLFRGTQWVVFEPNDETLWAQIRLDIGAFMQQLFLQGAFQGSSPNDAYFVKCNSETTTQTDIDNGIVNIMVGFAPLKPAEFVVLQIQQISPQS